MLVRDGQMFNPAIAVTHKRQMNEQIRKQLRRTESSMTIGLSHLKDWFFLRLTQDAEEGLKIRAT